MGISLFNINSDLSRAPAAAIYSGKYGPNGLYSTDALSPDIPHHLATLLCNTANFSLSKSSWDSYKTAGRMLKLCEAETKVDLDFPMTHTKVLTFVGWLLDRNVSHATIDKYLSGVRQLHLAAGQPNPNLRTDLVKQIIKGRQHQNNIEKTIGENKSRIPVTPNIMLLIKKDLSTSDMPNKQKLLVWSLSTLMFNGAFRIGEVLAENKTTFDPYSTLLETDLTVKETKINLEPVNLLQVRLKTEKTSHSGKHTLVDVFASEGPLCPVRAFTKWSRNKILTRNLPLFKEEDGSPYTCKQFNSYLKNFASKYLNLGDRSLSSHSFRSAMATLMAEMGYTDEELMSIGRWSSRAFEDYIKVPRAKRLAMARKIAELK